MCTFTIIITLYNLGYQSHWRAFFGDHVTIAFILFSTQKLESTLIYRVCFIYWILLLTVCFIKNFTHVLHKHCN